MRLIDGRRLARALIESAKEQVRQLRRQPGLGVIIVGDDPASHLYVQMKERASGEVGIRFVKHSLSADAGERDVLSRLAALNADQTIDAILIQLPLPVPLNPDRVIRAIDPAKDADGFHPQNVAAFLAGDETRAPVLARVIHHVLRVVGRNYHGLRATVLANSQTFAEPVCHLLTQLGLTAAPVSLSDDWRSSTRQSDVLVVAVGRPGLVTADAVKPGSVIVDIGTTRLAGRVVGDVDAASVQRVDGWLTPVPGGVGPVTVATLLESVIALAERH